MKHEVSACILIPTLAVLYAYPAKVGIKMHALSSCFISTAFSVLFTAVPINTENSKIYFIFVVVNLFNAIVRIFP